jgi:hypothetical protein
VDPGILGNVSAHGGVEEVLARDFLPALLVLMVVRV